jgi:hypothetical protein
VCVVLRVVDVMSDSFNRNNYLDTRAALVTIPLPVLILTFWHEKARIDFALFKIRKQKKKKKHIIIFKKSHPSFHHNQPPDTRTAWAL